MDNKNLENKLLNTLKDFTNKVGDIREQCINDVNKNIEKVEDKDKQEFLNKSLKNALSGNLTAEDFITQLKEL